jgi:2-polyprenyl-6-methoxyphenol hydroxylase-like FAD-dependent oxidoreductase
LTSGPADVPARLLLVGGGIGGLAAAIALRDAPLETVVLERAADLARVELGAGITLWPNAVRVLDQLGVGEEVRERGWVFDRMEQRTARGRLLSRWPLDHMAARLGAPALGVGRPALHAALARAAAEQVQSASECVRFEQDAAGVSALLADGRSERGELLVGADGLDSTIRAALLGPQPPRQSGLGMWRGSVSLEASEIPQTSFMLHWGAAAKFIYFRSGPEQLSWEAVVARPHGEQVPIGGRVPAVLEIFAGWPEEILRIVRATPEQAVAYTEVVDRLPSERWGEGRVTLLGDAAHPMTYAVGQGAAQALEDGVALAAALRADGASSAALRSYEQRRMKRSAHFQGMAWRLARLGLAKSPVACAARDTFTQCTSRIGLRMQEKDMAVDG